MVTEQPIKIENKISGKENGEILKKNSIWGIDKTYIVLFLVSFSQGIQGLSDLAVSYLYKDDLKLQPYEVSRIGGIISIPWIIKPLFGFVSDSFPIYGYRRKPYLLIFGFLVSLSWILMGLYVNDLSKAIAVAFICSFSTCFCNVIGEALVVELSQKQSSTDSNSSAKNVSLFFMTKSIGSLLTAFSSGALLEYVEKRNIFLITAIFPLLIVISSIVLNEKRINENVKEITHQIEEEEKIHQNFHISSDQLTTTCDDSNFKIFSEKTSEEKENNEIRNIKTENKLEEENLSLTCQLAIFCSFLKTDKIYKPVIFIFLFMITPSYSDVMFFFYTNKLKFEPIAIGRLKLVYGFATIIGIYLYNNYLKETSFKKIIFVSTILSSLLSMSSIILVERINLKLGIPDFFFCMGADALNTALSEINFLPILVLACNLCPKNIEGTLYAFLMSIVNLSSLFSNQIGAIISQKLGITSTNFENFKYLILIGNIAMLLPMPFLLMINENDYIKKEDEQISDDEKKCLIGNGIENYLKNRNEKDDLIKIDYHERKSHNNILNKDLIKYSKKFKEDNNEQLSVKSS